jgi:hypothetical protein
LAVVAAVAIVVTAALVVLRTCAPSPILMAGAATAEASDDAMTIEHRLTGVAGRPVEAPGTAMGRRTTREESSVPPFDEFAIRAAIRSVPSPGEGALLSVEKIVVSTSSVVALAVHIRVEGVDNPAWNGLPLDERKQYVRDVTSALMTLYPHAEATHQWDVSYYTVTVWERFRVREGWELVSEDGDQLVCLRIESTWRGQVLECRGVGISGMIEVPAVRQSPPGELEGWRAPSQAGAGP